MRIVVNDIAASMGGAMSILRDFYACVAESDKENQWVFLLNDQYFEETDNVKIIALPQVKQSRLRKLWFDFVSGRRLVNELRPDVYFSLQNTVTFGVRAPQVVYIHQPVPFQPTKKFSFFKKTERSMAVIQNLIGPIIKLSAKKCDRIIVQTQWMKEAVHRLCRVPLDKIRTNLPAVNQMFAEKAETEFDQTAFFYPTSGAIYKNNDCVFQASQMLDSKGVAHAVTLTLPQEESCGSVACVGRIPFEEVMSRYQRATLLFPSYIETYGYPMAEARMVGTIALAADTPFAREVLDGYENAYFFDPFKPEELAYLMEQVISGKLTKKEITQSMQNEAPGWEQVIQWVLDTK